MNANKNIAVFILSHGRPDKLITYRELRRRGYTGKIYIIIDDQDASAEVYKEKYGDEVIMFSKNDYADKFDIMDNFSGNKVIVYARNSCYDIARKLGLDYFFEYEDDYTKFEYRYVEGDKLAVKQVKNLDYVFSAMVDCLESTKIDTLALSQGGDFIGGIKSFKQNAYKRKSMNTFLFKVNVDPANDIKFIGRMNDDVNTYLTQGKLGKVFFQTPNLMITQVQTQSSSGGNTEAYKNYGTYVKSFYSVMAAPDCCKISLIGTTHMRYHHSIKWDNAVPKILPESYKKL